MTSNAATTADIRDLIKTIPAKSIPTLTPKNLQDMLIAQGYEVSASTRVATSTELKKARESLIVKAQPSGGVAHPRTGGGPVENRTLGQLASVGTTSPTKIDRFARKLVMACGGSVEKAIQAIHSQGHFFAELTELLSDD